MGVWGCRQLIGVEVASAFFPGGGGGLGCCGGGSFSGRRVQSASGLFGVGAGAGRRVRCSNRGLALIPPIPDLRWIRGGVFCAGPWGLVDGGSGLRGRLLQFRSRLFVAFFLCGHLPPHPAAHPHIYHV